MNEASEKTLADKIKLNLSAAGRRYDFKDLVVDSKLGRIPRICALSAAHRDISAGIFD